MVKRLIHWLGGFTSKDMFESIRNSNESFGEKIIDIREFMENITIVKDQIIALKEVEINSLKSQLEDTKKDRDFYREKLFLEKGILFPEVQEGEQRTHLEPISTGRIPWSTRRRKLENDDRKRAAVLQQDAKAQADATKTYWDKKNEANKDALQ